MHLFIVLLLYIGTPVLYLTMAAVIGGLSLRDLRGSCEWRPAHQYCYHGTQSSLMGVLWPLSWLFVLYSTLALLPTREERNEIQAKKIKELEKELGIRE